MLRIYIERDAGVSVDLCADVSRHVSDLLDVEEILPEAYTLEVSSPGWIGCCLRVNTTQRMSVNA